MQRSTPVTAWQIIRVGSRVHTPLDISNQKGGRRDFVCAQSARMGAGGQGFLVQATIYLNCRTIFCKYNQLV